MQKPLQLILRGIEPPLYQKEKENRDVIGRDRSQNGGMKLILLDGGTLFICQPL